MATEQYVNDAASTLNGNIDDTVTTLDVVNATSFPASGDFRIKIGDELLLVTGVAGETFTVTRGIEGSTPASHLIDDPVTHVVTAASIERVFRKSVSEAGAIGSRPAAGDVGRVYIPDNGLTFHRDNGSIWTPYGPIHRFTQPPAIGSFTGVNTTGATASDQGGHIHVQKPPQNGINISLWVKAAPATPYTITAAMMAALSSSSSQPACFGLCFRQSTDGNKPDVLAVCHTNITTVGRFAYSSLTARSGATQNHIRQDIWWLRIEDDNTDRKMYISPDGLNWALVHSISRTTTITADQVGFFVDHGSVANAYDMHVKLLSWEEA